MSSQNLGRDAQALSDQRTLLGVVHPWANARCRGEAATQSWIRSSPTNDASSSLHSKASEQRVSFDNQPFPIADAQFPKQEAVQKRTRNRTLLALSP